MISAYEQAHQIAFEEAFHFLTEMCGFDSFEAYAYINATGRHVAWWFYNHHHHDGSSP